MPSELFVQYARWQFRLPRSTKDFSRVALLLAFVTFVAFQTTFTVFVKVTGDIYGPNLALYDTQFMNIVYALLCIPPWSLSLALRLPAVQRFTPEFFHDWELKRRSSWRTLLAEQLWIGATSACDAIAALLYGIGGNGAPADFQAIVSNAVPFVLQLMVYAAWPRQRRPRMAHFRKSRWWGVAFVVGALLLVAGVAVSVVNPGTGHTQAPCPYLCFVLAAVFTTASWSIKEYLFSAYESNAVHVNTWNAMHMVWMTFPMFLLQLRVDADGCQTVGTIAQNFRDGWDCMRNQLSSEVALADSLSYGCADAGWTEWVYAITTWLAGMAQFPLCRMTSSAVQFAATILSAVLSYACFTAVPANAAFFGISEPFTPQVLVGVLLVVLGSFPYFAAERDVHDDPCTDDEDSCDGDADADLLNGDSKSRTIAETDSLLPPSIGS